MLPSSFRHQWPLSRPSCIAQAIASCCRLQRCRRQGLRLYVVSYSSTTSSHHYDAATNLVSRLKDPSLLITPVAKFGDTNISAERNISSTFPVYDPAQPSSLLAHVPNLNAEVTRHAIETSAKALPAWRDETTALYRSQRLIEWSRLVQQHKDDLAVIMTMESGKPLQESYSEITYGASYLDFYAAEAVRPNSAGGGFIIPTPFAKSPSSSSSSSSSDSASPPSPPQPRGHVMAWQQAVGVTALISPWNFPLAMITRKVAPALAVGCTALVKPSDRTPLTTVALHTLGQRAGIPPDVLQLM